MSYEESWVTVHEFARKSKRRVRQIYALVQRGNQFRKLKAKKVRGQVLIALSELNNFPFTRNDMITILKRKVNHQNDIINELYAMKRSNRR